MKTINITSGTQTTQTNCENFKVNGSFIYVKGLQGNSINLPQACDNGFITIEGQEVKFGRDGYIYPNDVKLTLSEEGKENWDHIFQIRCS